MKNSSRFILNILLAYLAIAVSILFLELTLYLIPSASIGGNHSQFYLFGLLSILLIVFYFVSEYRRNGKIKFSLMFWIVGGVFLFTGLLSIWVQPFTETLVSGSNTVDVSFTFMDKARYTLRLFILVGIAILVIHATTHKKFSLKSYHWMYYVLIFIGLISILVSVIVEWNKYVAIFTWEKTSTERFPTICSMYGNENVYAITLTFSLASILIVREMKKHWWHLLMYFIILLELIFTSCVACLAATLIFSFGYLAFKTITGLKKEFIKYLILLSVYIAIAVILIVAVYFFNKYKIKPMSNIIDFFIEEIINKDYSTFSGRTTLWSIAGKIIFKNPLTILFGRGYGMGMKIFHYQEAMELSKPLTLATVHVHNAYIDIMLDFGVVGLLVYLLGCVLFIKSIIHLFKHDKASIGFTYLITFIAFNVLGTFECVYPFKGSMNGLTYAGLFVLPPFTLMNVNKNEITLAKEQEEVTYYKEHKFDRTPVLMIASLSIALISAVILTNKSVIDDFRLFGAFIAVMENALLIFISAPIVVPVLNIYAKGYMSKMILYYLLSLSIPTLLFGLALGGVIHISTILYLPLVIHIVVNFFLIFLIHIIQERKLDFSLYKKVFIQFDLYSLMAILIGVISTFAVSLILNFNFNDANHMTAIFLLVMGLAIIMFILFIGKRNKCSKYFDCYNSIYNRYEIFMLKKEKGK